MEKNCSDKFYSFIGLARKSGNAVLGLENIEKAMVKLKLAVIASDAAERTVRNVRRLCGAGATEGESPPLRCIPYINADCTKTEMGRLMGAKEVSAIGITDQGFAEQIIKNAKGVFYGFEFKIQNT